MDEVAGHEPRVEKSMNDLISSDSKQANGDEGIRVQGSETHGSPFETLEGLTKEMTDPACAEALGGAEEGGRCERADDNAGGVRVELGVRAIPAFWEMSCRGLGSGGLGQKNRYSP